MTHTRKNKSMKRNVDRTMSKGNSMSRASCGGMVSSTIGDIDVVWDFNRLILDPGEDISAGSWLLKGDNKYGPPCVGVL